MKEDEVEKPKGYLFGKIPYYENRFAPDGTFYGAIKPFIYAACLTIPLVLLRHYSGG